MIDKLSVRADRPMNTVKCQCWTEPGTMDCPVCQRHADEHAELRSAERAYYRAPTDENLARLKAAELAIDGAPRLRKREPVCDSGGNGLTFDGERSFEL